MHEGCESFVGRRMTGCGVVAAGVSAVEWLLPVVGHMLGSVSAVAPMVVGGLVENVVVRIRHCK